MLALVADGADPASASLRPQMTGGAFLGSGAPRSTSYGAARLQRGVSDNIVHGTGRDAFSELDDDLVLTGRNRPEDKTASQTHEVLAKGVAASEQSDNLPKLPDTPTTEIDLQKIHADQRLPEQPPWPRSQNSPRPLPRHPHLRPSSMAPWKPQMPLPTLRSRSASTDVPPTMSNASDSAHTTSNSLTRRKPPIKTLDRSRPFRPRWPGAQTHRHERDPRCPNPAVQDRCTRTVGPGSRRA